MIVSPHAYRFTSSSSKKIILFGLFAIVITFLHPTTDSNTSTIFVESFTAKPTTAVYHTHRCSSSISSTKSRNCNLHMMDTRNHHDYTRSSIDGSNRISNDIDNAGATTTAGSGDVVVATTVGTNSRYTLTTSGGALHDSIWEHPSSPQDEVYDASITTFDTIAIPRDTTILATDTASSFATTTSTTATPSTTPQGLSFKTLKQRVTRRLNTHEDFMGVHKISASLWVLSTLCIAAVGLLNGFSTIPNFLEIPTWIYLYTSVIQGVTGYHMAIKYRGNDPVGQKGMINMSFQMISIAVAGFYVSPFASEAFNDYVLGNGILVASLMPTVIIGVDEVIHLKDNVAKRALRNKEKSEDHGLLGDVASYGMASVTALLTGIIAVGFAADPCHDRTWLFNVAAMADSSVAAAAKTAANTANGHLPSLSASLACTNMIAENFYATALFNVATGAGAFAITLRDKKLISKSMEQRIIAACTIPAVALTLHCLPDIF